MLLPFLHSVLRRVMLRWPQIFRAMTWTILLSLTVAVTSFAPEIAFVSAISPSWQFPRRPCSKDGLVRLPVDLPGEVVCVPARMMKRSKLDFFVPTTFAALVVAGSAFLVRSLSLWDGGRE